MSVTGGNTNLNYYDSKLNSKTLFDYEKELVAKVDQLNKDYLKYAKCNTIHKILSGTIKSGDDRNIYNSYQENTLKITSSCNTKSDACKIPGVTDARQIYITNKDNGNNYSSFDPSIYTDSKVNWTVKYGANSYNTYTVEKSGNDTYIYGPSVINITYKEIPVTDCINNGGFSSSPNDTNLTNLINEITTIKTNMDSILTNININSNSLRDTSTFDQSHNAIEILSNEVITLRNDLDQKMQEIQKKGKSGYQYDNKIRIDSTIYSSLAWTVLATSLLYYVFVNME